MDFWNHIYENFNPIAIDFGFISIHWYGIMYISALLTALWFAKWIIKKDNIAISELLLDNYFIWIEIGIILGARIWYILFYDPNTSYYLTQPWQIFNPFSNGEFVGIRGMSYHGAVVGAGISSYLFSRRNPGQIYKILDVVALSVPVGFVFGRIGNFLNQELVGRATDVPWGIYVDGVLRHPSQLYEGFLEGVVIAIIIFLYRKRKKFDGALIGIYGVLYGTARFIVEFWREPDSQLGYLYDGWLTMGQIQSFIMIVFSIAIYFTFKVLSKRAVTVK
ncbi:Prolipoprotein diacylglyceryl transferase [hydrothermal vent metagenome]|uniref:Prolipoprotein diacylglyceryl transferase n=1 Tax=hydrothermal vent metagenome TaxID=652676 RepID=A0A1W1CZL8_9ZZZZ